MDSQLIYDVGMNNGDDTAYYLRRRYRVIAIEPNPELVDTASKRFHYEIKSGRLKILNVGVTAEDGEFTFWICRADSRLSSFSLHDASLNHKYNVSDIRVKGRKFCSILNEFGVPFYLKIDIQGNDSLCIEALDPANVPKFISVEWFSDLPMVALLRKRGFNQFKCISQTHFLPLQFPPTDEACRAQFVELLGQTRNTLVRAFRRLGGRRWLQRQLNHLRTYDGWMFPPGSSGPFGDDLPGRWLSYEELHITTEAFARMRQDDPRAVLWASPGLESNPFWADLHARSD
jgi:FkbM family methyltransferase